MPLLLWWYFAAWIKRLHDRNKTGWWLVPYFIVPGIYSQFEDRLPDSNAMALLGLAVSIVAFWGLVEMLCLKGTTGPNRFGPDPLAPVTPEDARPHWEQQSELEFVPHNAGPSPGQHVKRGHD